MTIEGMVLIPDDGGRAVERMARMRGVGELHQILSCRSIEGRVCRNQASNLEVWHFWWRQWWTRSHAWPHDGTRLRYCRPKCFGQWHPSPRRMAASIKDREETNISWTLEHSHAHSRSWFRSVINFSASLKVGLSPIYQRRQPKQRL